MGIGIIVCGLNGVGKSTLGKALAEELHFYFIDSEDLFFQKTDSDHPYAFPRSREEAERLLLREVRTHDNFVFASVIGDYGEVFYPFFHYAVWIDVPKDIRVQRVKDRSFQKFGNRMLPGGDLYETEETFFRFVESRAESIVEDWIRSLNCPVIRIDGMRSIEENVDLIIEQIKNKEIR